LSSECAENLGRCAIHLFAIVARVRDPIAGDPLVGCTYRQTHVAHRELSIKGFWPSLAIFWTAEPGDGA